MLVGNHNDQSFDRTVNTIRTDVKGVSMINLHGCRKCQGSEVAGPSHITVIRREDIGIA